MEARRAGHGGLEARAALPRYACPNAKAAMSVPGQSLQKRDARATSAFPLIATTLRTSLHFAFVPDSDVRTMTFN